MSTVRFASENIKQFNYICGKTFSIIEIRSTAGRCNEKFAV